MGLSLGAWNVDASVNEGYCETRLRREVGVALVCRGDKGLRGEDGGRSLLLLDGDFSRNAAVTLRCLRLAKFMNFIS